MPTVTLTLTEKPAYTLWEALETYNCIMIGQFSAVTDLFLARHFDRAAAAAALKAARQVVMPELDPWEQYGIESKEVREQARIAFDVEQVLRHALAWHRHPEGGVTIDFDKPYQTGPEPLPRAEIRD